MQIEKRLIKASEAGKYLGIPTKDVVRACQQKRIPCVKLPGRAVRIDKQRLDHLLDGLGINPWDLGMTLKDREGID